MKNTLFQLYNERKCEEVCFGHLICGLTPHCTGVQWLDISADFDMCHDGSKLWLLTNQVLAGQHTSQATTVTALRIRWPVRLFPSHNQKTNSEFSFSTTQPDTPSGAKKATRCNWSANRKRTRIGTPTNLLFLHSNTLMHSDYHRVLIAHLFFQLFPLHCPLLHT
jgi:hypothetical protein